MSRLTVPFPLRGLAHQTTRLSNSHSCRPGRTPRVAMLLDTGDSENASGVALRQVHRHDHQARTWGR